MEKTPHLKSHVSFQIPSMVRHADSRNVATNTVFKGKTEVSRGLWHKFSIFSSPPYTMLLATGPGQGYTLTVLG